MSELTRRRFLRGTGGLMLALPFLESLAAPAAAQQASRPKRLVSLQSAHGGAWAADLHPAQATLTESLAYAGHQVRRGQLALSVNNGRAQLSKILSAPSSQLTARLVSKMNVLRGLGVPFMGFHHTGGHLGNWGTIQGNLHGMHHRPTIDTVIAHAPGFYERPPLLHVMLCGADEPEVAGSSWGYENPRRKQGQVVRAAPAGSSVRLFERVYAPPPSAVNATPRPRRPLVDRVLQDYHRLRADVRLSQRDRLRLDAHISHLEELEQKLSQPRPACPAVEVVADSGAARLSVPNADELRPEPLFPGLHWHQYLGTVLQVMGVPASEYVRGELGGYGDEFVAPGVRESGQYAEATFRASGGKLPFL